MEKKLNIGINIVIIRDGKLLLGKRKGSTGDGDWGVPGGHLELGEKFKDAARRELMEETGMTAEDFIFRCVINQPGDAKHYVQIGFEAVGVSGESELKEHDYCLGWEWFDIQHLPPNIFFAHTDLLRAYFDKSDYFE